MTAGRTTGVPLPGARPGNSAEWPRALTLQTICWITLRKLTRTGAGNRCVFAQTAECGYEYGVLSALRAGQEASQPHAPAEPDAPEAPKSKWRDPKRYLWLLGPITPGMVGLSWLLVWLTGIDAFWWAGSLLTFGLVPLLDHIVGPEAETTPGDLRRLEDDPFYRIATHLFLPAQYLSLIFACWLWAGGGWVTMSPVDKLGLMAAVGTVGGIAINAAHELGHKRGMSERRLSKIALAQTCYGHFFVEHNRGHHVRVATPEDPASSRPVGRRQPAVGVAAGVRPPRPHP